MVVRRRRGGVRVRHLPRPAAEEWESLDAPWRHAFQLAWEAYKMGTVPAGAVVADPDGRILGKGRDHVYDASPDAAALRGTRLAHAELLALARLDPYERYEEAILYSTVEPCALCVGATVTATVGMVRYGSSDPYAGAAGQIPVNDATDRLPVTFEGPLPGTPGLLGAVLRLELYMRTNPDAHFVKSHRRRYPDAVAIAEDLRTQDVLGAAARSGLSFKDVLPQMWAAADRILAA